MRERPKPTRGRTEANDLSVDGAVESDLEGHPIDGLPVVKNWL